MVASFEAAVQELREPLLAQARALVGPEDAEDVLQVAMMRAWRYTHSEPESWRAWLQACLRNAARDWLRRRQAQPVLEVLHEA